ncbi:ParB N-terminal domain-containing protein [Candidatus Laterigemmans baculatus]|uniref:hypothetical protein n=1 Tax=Candidatus Laterigemmans baculatus TaxID=2770505 RepID=UPI0013DB0C8F|nr:hypothetical protein [Candidatus Laterigemmans baculatus]
MPTLMRKKRASQKSSRASAAKTKIKVSRLRYLSARDKKWLTHESIRLHPAALSMPKLEREEYQVLKRSIAPEGRPVHLINPIVITSKGLIVDGRHRARALVESGHGEELISQIAARQGEWVELLPERENPLHYAVRIQRGRRNCPAWMIALAALPEYEKAVEEGNRLRGKRGRTNGAKSPVDAFCENIGISKSVFNQISWVQRTAPPHDFETLKAGDVTLNALYNRLKAEEKERLAACGAGTSSCDEPSTDGCSTKKSRQERGGKRATDGRSTEGGKPTARRSPRPDRERAAELVNQLLSGDAVQAAAAAARDLIASLDAGPRQLLIDAAHEAAST